MPVSRRMDCPLKVEIESCQSNGNSVCRYEVIAIRSTSLVGIKCLRYGSSMSNGNKAQLFDRTDFNEVKELSFPLY